MGLNKAMSFLIPFKVISFVEFAPFNEIYSGNKKTKKIDRKKKL